MTSEGEEGNGANELRGKRAEVREGRLNFGRGVHVGAAEAG